MKRIGIVLALLFISMLPFRGECGEVEGIGAGGDEDAPTRFPAGAFTPMLGASVIGYDDSVLGGVTLGGGYYVIDRLELFATGTVYFGDATMLSVDPGAQWIFWETRYFAPYLKARGGPFFDLSGDNGTSWTAFGGGGAYIFAGNLFGVKLGGLAGYIIGDTKTFAWLLDLGLMF
ncbi:MAG: hypothetical protein Kow0090_19010 [Myxococcota bacterium]